MKNAEEKALYEQFSSEFAALNEDKQPVVLELTKVQAWIMLSQIQLALRHPKNKGPTSVIVKHVAQQLEKAVATTPALTEVAKRGWNAKYDSDWPDKQ